MKMHTLKNLSTPTKINIKQQWLNVSGFILEPLSNKTSQWLNLPIQNKTHNITENLYITRFDHFGIIRPGCWVQQGDTLVGKRKKQFDTKNTPEEQLLYDIFGSTNTTSSSKKGRQNEKLESVHNTNFYTNPVPKNYIQQWGKVASTKDNLFSSANACASGQFTAPAHMEKFNGMNMNVKDSSHTFLQWIPQEKPVFQLMWSKQYQSDISISPEERWLQKQVGTGVKTPFITNNNESWLSSQFHSRLSSTLPYQYKDGLTSSKPINLNEERQGKLEKGKNENKGMTLQYSNRTPIIDNFKSLSQKDSYENDSVSLGYSTSAITDSADDHGQFKDTSFVLSHDLNARVLQTYFFPENSIPVTYSYQNHSLIKRSSINEAAKKSYDSNTGTVIIYLITKRPIQIGDKLAGRHGNKGIVSNIIPQEDMPYLSDGTPIDLLLNPLGVPSRMNVGQVYECLLGLAGTYLKEYYRLKPFDESYGEQNSRAFVYSKLYQASTLIGVETDSFYSPPTKDKFSFRDENKSDRLQQNQLISNKFSDTEELFAIPKSGHPNKRAQWLFHGSHPGKTKVFDGRSGELFEHPITVGVSYIMKLVHLVDEKMHARSTGPYSLITQQPLKGRSKHGGQRLGEMEVWAFEGFGASYLLQEMMTIKSDDIYGRNLAFREILNKHPVKQGSLPESFRVVAYELRALCFDIFYTPN